MSDPARKVAIVTGAGSGIGAAVAARLNGDGYTVYATSRKVDAPRSAGPGLLMRALDVRDDRTVAALVDEIMGEAGRIDVLVNNAGAMLAGGLEETSLAEGK